MCVCVCVCGLTVPARLKAGRWLQSSSGAPSGTLVINDAKNTCLLLSTGWPQCVVGWAKGCACAPADQPVVAATAAAAVCVVWPGGTAPAGCACAPAGQLEGTTAAVAVLPWAAALVCVVC